MILEGDSSGEGLNNMKKHDSLLIEGLVLADKIMEKTDELAELVCKITDEKRQQVDEYVPKLLARRIEELRAKQVE